MITDYQPSVGLFKRYRSDKHFSRVYTYKMAAKINWHRYGTELRHCYHVDFVLIGCSETRTVSSQHVFQRWSSQTAVQFSTVRVNRHYLTAVFNAKK